MKIEGEHTTATVHGSEEMFDDAFFSQVQEIADHEGFQNDIVVQPDGHAGAGAVIGFTMEMGEKVTPNVVGSDIGCGVSAVNIGQPDHLLDNLGNERFWSEVDSSIRSVVPMGLGRKHKDPDYHMVDDFPWEACEQRREFFEEEHDLGFSGVESYGHGYLMETCKKVALDVNKAIASMGTLGSGNHFLEISRSEETGDFWIVVHSGSRAVGGAIASYWQDTASELNDVSYILNSIEDWMWEYMKFDSDTPKGEIRQWILGGKGEAFYDMDAVREDFEGEDIEATRQSLVALIPDDNRNEALDYLEGDERLGYITDMIFAQNYARENRWQMLMNAVDVLDVRVRDEIDSIHNYIDFRDGVIRKGATNAREDVPLIIPFNMAEGAVICVGKGNEDYNNSAPHGAGRRGSRTWAKHEFDMDQFEEEMDGVHSSSISEETLDEIPSAYKDSDDIMDFLGPTAEVQEHLTPVLSMKGE